MIKIGMRLDYYKEGVGWKKGRGDYCYLGFFGRYYLFWKELTFLFPTIFNFNINNI